MSCKGEASRVLVFPGLDGEHLVKMNILKII